MVANGVANPGAEYSLLGGAYCCLGCKRPLDQVDYVARRIQNARYLIVDVDFEMPFAFGDDIRRIN